MDIKPIETQYSGYKFRSRLEARWAVFFDAAGIKYQYEPQGYEVGINNRKKYLPDFFLPDTKTWVEVKGDIQGTDFQKLADAVDWGKGLPYTEDSIGSSSGLLVLGKIPNAKIDQHRTAILHTILQHNKGGWLKYTYFDNDGVHKTSETCDIYFDSSWGNQHKKLEWVKNLIDSVDGDYYVQGHFLSVKIEKAYDAARKARFEYGCRG
ncbi:MAG TPA: hypothetical protein DCR95_09875 [Desulfobacter sp.]|jgi:hypothetical protein|nr:hypothetical protein [Desulfobacter sp.]